MKQLLSFCILFFLVSKWSKAQSEIQSSSFNAGTGTNGKVTSIVQLSSQKFIIAGDFTAYNGGNQAGIVRLNANGTVDPTFQAGSGFNGPVNCLFLQNDGKILVAGNFTGFNNQAVGRLVRLNVNGTLDQSFNIGSGANGNVRAIVEQADGKILVGGDFTFFNGQSANRLLRLNADGNIDLSFQIGQGINGPVHSIALNESQQIIVGGQFNLVKSQNRQSLAVLNSNGDLNNLFAGNQGPNASINKIVILPDGRYLIGGDFNEWNNTEAKHLIRLNSDFSIDPSFLIGQGFNDNVYDIDKEANGKYLVAGAFSMFDTLTIGSLLRLNENGSIDTTLNADPGADAAVYAIKALQNQQIALGGSFTQINLKTLSGFLITDSTGMIDPSYNAGGGVGTGGAITVAAEQNDGKLLIGGTFSTFQGVAANRLARINKDGTIDTTFNAGQGPNNNILIIIAQPDGKILLFGEFTSFNGVNRNRLIRLFSDGSLDTNFVVGNGANNAIRAAALLEDGKILIAGNFTNYAGTTRNRLVRLNTNGSLDNDFSIGTGVNNTVNDLKLDANNKILIAGTFSSYAGTTRNRIARINTDGSVDTTFNPLAGAANTIQHLFIQPDGKIIISGSFTTYQGQQRLRLARINADANLDQTFVPDLSVPNNTLVNSVINQTDGSILLVGSFTLYNNLIANRIVRINSNGTILSQNYGIGANNTIFQAIKTQDGHIVLAGQFSTFNGLLRNGLTKLNNCTVPNLAVSNPVCEGATVSFSVSSGNSYAWSGPNNFNSNMQQPSLSNITFNGAGIYQVVVETAAACFHTLPFEIEVNANPSLEVTNNSPLCEGDTLILSSTTDGSSVWSYNQETTAASQLQINAVAMNNAGSYNLQVQKNACLVNVTNTVVVNPAPDLFVSYASPSCIGSIVNFMASGASTYEWSGPGGFSSNLANPIFTASNNNAGTYTVIGIDSNACQAQQTFELELLPEPNFSISSNSPLCLGESALLAAFGGIGYTWTGPNNFTSDLQAPAFFISNQQQEGLYTCEIIDANGCTQVLELQVDIDECLSIYQPSNHRIQIFPNPANEYLEIRNISPNASILLTDLSGRIVLMQNSGSVNATINLSELTTGYYLLQVDGFKTKVLVLK